MSSVGETLRRERLRKELSLDQISRETKISARLLEAIENDEFDRLPGGVFAKSFARQYARFLGLDEEELAAEVERAVNPERDLPSFIAPPEPAFKVPRVKEWNGARSTSSLLPALAGVVTVMLVCSAVYAWWLRSRRPAPVAQTRAAAQTTRPATASKPLEPALTPAAANTPETAPNTEVSQVVPAGNPEVGGAPLRVSLATDSEVWVHVWADNKSILEGTLQPGVEKAIDAEEAIRIRTGNAGDLHVTVNGKTAGEIGPKGQIRIVEITPKGVQILLPPPPKPAAPAPEPL